MHEAVDRLEAALIERPMEEIEDAIKNVGNKFNIRQFASTKTQR